MDNQDFLFFDNELPGELLSPLFISDNEAQGEGQLCDALTDQSLLSQSVKPADIFMTSDLPVDPALRSTATGLLTPETEAASLAAPSPLGAQEPDPAGPRTKSRPKAKAEQQPAPQQKKRGTKNSKSDRVVDEKEEQRLKKGAEAAMRHRLRKKGHEKKLTDAVQAAEDINTRRKAEYRAANDEAVLLIDRALDHAQLCANSELITQVTTIRERIRSITSQRNLMAAYSTSRIDGQVEEAMAAQLEGQSPVGSVLDGALPRR